MILKMAIGFMMILDLGFQSNTEVAALQIEYFNNEGKNLLLELVWKKINGQLLIFQ